MSDATLVRSFIALTPSSEVRAEVASIIQRCKKSAPDRSLSWVRDENLHITLRFLGTVPRETLDTLAIALEENYRHVPAFDIRLHRIKVLPSRRRPRVLSLSVEVDGDRLDTLKAETDAGCERVGLEKDPKPLRAHMTLARFRSRPIPPGLTNALKKYDEIAVGEFHMDTVSLFESTLTDTGPNYTSLKEFRLNGNRIHYSSRDL